jgi:hypothetical protein
MSSPRGDTDQHSFSDDADESLLVSPAPDRGGSGGSGGGGGGGGSAEWRAFRAFALQLRLSNPTPLTRRRYPWTRAAAIATRPRTPDPGAAGGGGTAARWRRPRRGDRVRCRGRVRARLPMGASIVPGAVLGRDVRGRGVRGHSVRASAARQHAGDVGALELHGRNVRPSKGRLKDFRARSSRAQSSTPVSAPTTTMLGGARAKSEAARGVRARLAHGRYVHKRSDRAQRCRCREVPASLPSLLSVQRRKQRRQRKTRRARWKLKAEKKLKQSAEHMAAATHSSQKKNATIKQIINQIDRSEEGADFGMITNGEECRWRAITQNGNINNTTNTLSRLI